VLAVDEEDILAGRKSMAEMGFYVEPTSAVVWGALEQISGQAIEPVVLVLTGSGLKWLGSTS
jgi:threonine synthase